MLSGYVTLGIFKNETNKEGGAMWGRVLQGLGILHGLERLKKIGVGACFT